MKRFFRHESRNEAFEKVVAFSIVVLIVINLFQFSVYIRCVGNVALDRYSAAVNDMPLIGQVKSCVQQANEASDSFFSQTTGNGGGAGTSGGSIEAPGGGNGAAPIPGSIEPAIPGTNGPIIPISFYNAASVSVACIESQAYYFFNIPNNAPPQAIGTQTLTLTNNTGWDMWIKIIKVDPLSGVTITSYEKGYKTFSNGQSIAFHVGWFWDVPPAYAGDRGAATVYFQTACVKPLDTEIYNPIPNSVANFKATDVTESAAKLVWDKTEYATKYQIVQSGATLYEGAAAEFNVSGLYPGAGYAYSVRAGNEKGWSNFTSTTFVTKGTSLSPSAPTNFKLVSSTDNSVTLGWDSVSAATSYTLAREWGTLYQGPNNTFTIAGLKPGEGHWYELKAGNKYGESNWQSIFITSGSSGASAIPYVPKNFRVVGRTDTSLTVAWDPVSTADSYYINKGQWNGPTVYSGPGATATIAGLTPGTNYWLMLFAKNSVDVSTQASLNANTTGNSPYNPPANFVIQNVTNTSMDLNWDTVVGATSYSLLQNGTEVYKGAAPSFQATSLTPNTYYAFQVSANTGYGATNPASRSSYTTNTTYDGSANVSNPCQAATFTKSFDMPPNIKPGTSGILTIKMNNPSNQNLLFKITSVDKTGSYFEGDTPVAIQYDAAMKSVPPNSTLDVPAKWTLPGNADSSYSTKSGVATVGLTTVCP